ncbi:MAG TPA: hypothetical protein DD420_22220, partial [Streptomyces sp.]|nr:hypothetical protein [Streptomyces sp.]
SSYRRGGRRAQGARRAAGAAPGADAPARTGSARFIRGRRGPPCPPAGPEVCPPRAARAPVPRTRRHSAPGGNPSPSPTRSPEGRTRPNEPPRPRREWSFRAHFFQDPVRPGSLGVEAMCRLLRFHLPESGTGARGPYATADATLWGDTTCIYRVRGPGMRVVSDAVAAP